MAILTNPITLSVIVMVVLCLCKLNVILSLLVAAFVAGISGGLGVGDIMGFILEGFNGNAENALAYLLLGTFAAALAHIGLTDMLGKKIASSVKGNKNLLLATFVIIAIISGTIIPVHIAYIPILIPPLLIMMNEMKMDRRQAACVTEFGLCGPYITIPIGYGLIFQGIIADNMTSNGWATDVKQVVPGTIILFGGMLAGLIGSWWFYRKPREYKNIPIAGTEITAEDTKITKNHIVAFVAIAALLAGQLKFSMPVGAICGLLVMFLGGAIPVRGSDNTISEGIKLMGMISFIMLIAGGYANVVRNTGAVEKLIDAAMAILGNSRPAFVFVLILIGLLITMGIGTSFGTIPVIAILYVPMCQRMGLSMNATICLIACAAALGDAGSPASDSTLGPTAGLNADGQHDHIWDTCVPTFLFYDIPLFIAGLIGGLVL